jgi:hypothetical protein
MVQRPGRFKRGLRKAGKRRLYRLKSAPGAVT